MKQKKKYSLMKHLDFLLLDLLCVEICFSEPAWFVKIHFWN